MVGGDALGFGHHGGGDDDGNAGEQGAPEDDGFDATDAAVGGEEELGRERR